MSTLSLVYATCLETGDFKPLLEGQNRYKSRIEAEYKLDAAANKEENKESFAIKNV